MINHKMLKVWNSMIIVSFKPQVTQYLLSKGMGHEESTLEYQICMDKIMLR